MKEKEKQKSIDILVKYIWLIYFNNYLKEAQVISTDIWKKMNKQIRNKYNLC